MTYLPIKIQGRPMQPTLTTMSVGGENTRDLPQLLSPKYAQLISNYLITSDGGLAMRQGITLRFESGVVPIRMLEKFTDDIYLYGSSTVLYAYVKSTGVSTVIKTFANSGVMNGSRYGDYFFVTNKTEKLGRVSRTLAYDGQTGNFTAGLKVTGATSGATAIILTDADSGATGTLTLGAIVGTFVDNEIITDSSTGSATTNGEVGWTYTTISDSPICGVVEAIGKRLYLGNLLTDEAAVAYSAEDTGVNPPFTTFTATSGAAGAGQLTYRNAGGVNAIVGLGSNIIIFSDFGKWSFYIDVIDSAGTLVKVDRPVIDRQDLGGTAAVVTPNGIFYVNSAGLWQLISVGQPNVPFSDQESLASRFLGATYFDNIDADGAALVYDAKRELVLVSCKNDASANNFVVTFSPEFKAFTRIIGWNISTFLNDNQVIYGASSIDGKVWEIFEGFDDNGSEIYTEYLQELRTGDLEARQSLLATYVQGYLSPQSPVTVNFDIYDTTGLLVENKIGYTWEAQSDIAAISEYGSSSWGSSAWGGDIDVTGAMIESFDGGTNRIANFMRIRIHIESHSMAPHIINWVKLLTRTKDRVRRRHLTIN